MSVSDSEKDIEPPSITSVPALLGDDQEQQDSNTLYKYRDFGQVAEDDEDVAEIPPPTPSSRGSSESSIRVQKFPVKLYAILAQKEFHDIICWMPHGRSWKVLKPTMFESLVMPLFFEYSNYHSFNRLVNAWSFRRISSGPDRGSYYHELFLRGKPFLQKYMRRLPKTHKKLPMRKKDEPDFYKLDKTSTLPALEDAPVPGAAATTLAMRQQQQGIGPMTNHQHSPVSSVVTPPHLSPSAINQSAMGSGNMGPGGFSDAGMGPSGMMGPSNGIGPTGGMGHSGMGSSRMHGSGPGPMPPRFNGYNPPPDAFGVQDDYDLPPPLPTRRMHPSMGQGPMGMNGSGNGGNYGGDMYNPIGNGYIEGGSGGGHMGRYGGMPQQGMRRPMSMRQPPSPMDQYGGNDGYGPSGGSLGGQQDYYPAHPHQRQRGPTRPHQHQQYQQGQSRSPPPIPPQHMNTMPMHMRQMYGSMGNGGMGGQDDFVPGPPMRRPLQRGQI